jgi:hypothetical protein
MAGSAGMSRLVGDIFIKFLKVTARPIEAMLFKANDYSKAPNANAQ